MSGLLRPVGYVFVGIAVIGLLWTALFVVSATVEPVTAWMAERTVVSTAYTYARPGTLRDVRTMGWVMAGVSMFFTLAFGGAGVFMLLRFRHRRS